VRPVSLQVSAIMEVFHGNHKEGANHRRLPRTGFLLRTLSTHFAATARAGFMMFNVRTSRTATVACLFAFTLSPALEKQHANLLSRFAIHPERRPRPSLRLGEGPC
jgi:hypothetical protein